MTPFQDKLKQIKDRAEAATSACSADFGHDTDALMKWESEQLQLIAGTDVPALLAVIEELIEQRNACAKDSQWYWEPSEISRMDTELLKILVK